MVVDGALNKQIGARLGAAERTVKAHRAHVMEKMEVRSLADLIRAASQLRRSRRNSRRAPRAGCGGPRACTALDPETQCAAVRGGRTEIASWSTIVASTWSPTVSEASSARSLNLDRAGLVRRRAA